MKNISSSHRSLYLAFFELWNQKRFPKTIILNSKQVMALAKIGSKTTYHKLLRDLKNWGCLQYHPSNNPQVGSVIEMFRFDTLLDQKMDRTYPVSEQVPVQKMASFNKHKSKHIINSFKTPVQKMNKRLLIILKQKIEVPWKLENFIIFMNP